MPTPEQKRQKKLAKKRTKELAKKKELARHKNMLQSLAGQMKAAAVGPIDRCFISDALLDPQQKFGTVILSRVLPDRRLGCVRLVVDGMCLGVKRADGFVCYPAQLTEIVDQYEAESLRPAAPAAARKLVEAAIAYAQQFDLQPCGEYRKVEVIWGEIDPNECTVEFTFGGENGKPLYVAGPYDSPRFVANVLDKLQATAGEGNFVVDYEQMSGFAEHDDFGWAEDPELDLDIDQDFADDVIDAPSFESR